MLSTRIGLLEKFGVSSVILPYFGPVHSSFLILSKLSTKSRIMIDQFYEEILNCMAEYVISYEIWDKNWSMLLLPSDLFRFSINTECESLIENLIWLINNISANKGYYFNGHFMHKRLWINKFKLKPSLAVKMQPYLELLKNTSVIVDFRIQISSIFSFNKLRFYMQYFLSINILYSNNV